MCRTAVCSTRRSTPPCWGTGCPWATGPWFTARWWGTTPSAPWPIMSRCCRRDRAMMVWNRVTAAGRSSSPASSPLFWRQIYDLLTQYECYMVGETTVKVEHCLMALPGASLDTVTHVYSHEQGLFQCESPGPEWSGRTAQPPGRSRWRPSSARRCRPPFWPTRRCPPHELAQTTGEFRVLGWFPSNLD